MFVARSGLGWGSFFQRDAEEASVTGTLLFPDNIFCLKCFDAESRGGFLADATVKAGGTRVHRYLRSVTCRRHMVSHTADFCVCGARSMGLAIWGGGVGGSEHARVSSAMQQGKRRGSGEIGTEG